MQRIKIHKDEVKSRPKTARAQAGTACAWSNGCLHLAPGTKMMKREELSRIASVKFKKAITDCSHAVSHRVLAFCVMAACLVFTLAVTAANLRLTYVTDSHGARQVVLT